MGALLQCLIEVNFGGRSSTTSISSLRTSMNFFQSNMSLNSLLIYKNIKMLLQRKEKENLENKFVNSVIINLMQCTFESVSILSKARKLKQLAQYLFSVSLNHTQDQSRKSHDPRKEEQVQHSSIWQQQPCHISIINPKKSS